MNVHARASCFAVVLCASCSGELPSPSRVDKLRLFAMSAFEPDVPAGAGLTVRAVWTDASATAGRDVYFTWKLCDAAVTRESRRCLLASEGTELVSGGLLRDSLTLDALQIPGTGAATSAYFVLLAMCPDAPAAYNAELGLYTCPSEDGVPNEKREGIQSFRTVTVRTEGAFNHNPAFERVTLGETEALEGGHVTVPRCEDTDAGACAALSLRVIATADSVEARDDGMRESMLVSFFATSGRFSRPRAIGMSDDPLGANGALSSSWTPPRAPGAVSAWVAMRDGRGGDVVRAFVIDVR